ncbi:hypothetical protein [Roseomonas elaeocarpi]|uniref:Uncharacterized protein n=1 Tax=Roseomonas elaeocarpi TaxID=907779 RepID=A0ABV6JXL7_9PROT
MSDIAEPNPFPAEADLAAAADAALGPTGRFRLVCGAGAAAFVVDTIDGRSWRLDGDRWVPLRYEVMPPDPAP